MIKICLVRIQTPQNIYLVAYWVEKFSKLEHFKCINLIKIIQGYSHIMAHGVMVIVTVNRLSDPSSNPVWGFWHFT